jgi:hypothetical protein
MDIIIAIIVIAAVVGIIISLVRGARNIAYHQATGKTHPLKIQRTQARQAARTKHTERRQARPSVQARQAKIEAYRIRREAKKTHTTTRT